MHEIRIALRSTTRRVVLPPLLVAVAVIAGLAPMVHLASASVAPIVHEDAALRSARTVDDTAPRRRRTTIRRNRRRVRRRPSPASWRVALPRRPLLVTSTTPILRL